MLKKVYEYNRGSRQYCVYAIILRNNPPQAPDYLRISYVALRLHKPLEAPDYVDI